MVLSDLRPIGRSYILFAEAGEDQAAFNGFVRTQRRRVCMNRRRAKETFGLRAVVGRRKFRSSSWARQKRAAEVKRLKPSMQHGAHALFNTAMVLLEVIVEVLIRAMRHVFTKLTGNGTGVRAMTIAGDTIWQHAGHGTGRAEESLRGHKVSRLAQTHVHQMAVAVEAQGCVGRRYRDRPPRRRRHTRSGGGDPGATTDRRPAVRHAWALPGMRLRCGSRRGRGGLTMQRWAGCIAQRSARSS
jgi:hypothetical protein